MDVKGYAYMVTTVTLHREPIFSDSKAADVLLEAILFGRKQKWYYLLSFVIMPDHIHLVLIPREKSISECIKAVKGFSARKVNDMSDKKGSIWQEGFYDYILEDEKKTLGRMRYIEENPVRKGMAAQAEEYGYGSAKHREETDFREFF